MKGWVIILVLCCSCSAASKLRKAERLIKQAESMGAQWRVDTAWVEIRDTVPQIYVKEAHHIMPGDTVTIEKERLKIKVVRIPGDSIVVEGKCDTVTVVKRVPVTVTKEIKAKGNIKWWWLVIALLVGGSMVRIFAR
jgi:hypothetical protein